MEFEFENEDYGIWSFYEIDTSKVLTSEPRYAAENYTVRSIYDSGEHFLIFDYGFGQFGRGLDTVEFKFPLDGKLVLRGDTLEYLNWIPVKNY
ncbi:MAG: hypothetical protein JXQ96_01325 [Cyclobacteriaceae bacterium]